MLSMVRTSAKRRRPQRPEFADTTVWEVAHFERRLSTGHANVVITSLRKCTRGGVIVINSPLNLISVPHSHRPASSRFHVLFPAKHSPATDQGRKKKQK